MTNCYINYNNYRNPNFIHPLFQENRWNSEGKKKFNGELSELLDKEKIERERQQAELQRFKPLTPGLLICPPGWKITSTNSNEKDFMTCQRVKDPLDEKEQEYVNGSKSDYFKYNTMSENALYSSKGGYLYVNKL